MNRHSAYVKFHRAHRVRAHRVHGFSIIELIAALAVTGIIATGLLLWMSRPLEALQSAHLRAAAMDQADRITARLHDELADALPNSLRVACGGRCVEFIPVMDYGDYRAALPGDYLEFAAPDDRFDVLLPLADVPINGLQIVINNQNALSSGSLSAYSNDGSNNRASIVAGTTAAQIRIAAKQFPAPSPTQRFYVVDTPVSYLCQPSVDGGVVRRLSSYAIQPAQPDNTSAGDLLAGGVVECEFSLLQPNLLGLRLTVGSGAAEPVHYLAQVRAGQRP